MNFVKRAWQNVTFKKGRSLLLVIVMTVILVFIMAGLLIRNAAVTTVENTKNDAGASVTLAADREKAFSAMRKQTTTSTTTKPSLKMESVSLKTVEEVAKLKQVKNYNVTVATSVNASSFDAITTSSGNSVMMGGGQGPTDDSSNSGDITVTGVNNMSTITEFKNKKSKITSGRALTDSDVGTKNVVIESELAKEDNLKVGQTITVKATTSGTKSYKLTIVGIYKASSTSSNMMMGPGQSDPSNTIYTPYDLANTFKGQTNKVDSATYNLNSPTQKSAFLKAAKKDINTNKFSLTADDSMYQQLKKSMKQMENFANKIVWLVAIAGTIILALIIILMIRERRYEMGVLLSLGESRAKIIGQLLVEMFMLLLVSLTLAGVTGRFAGDILSKQMMSSVTTSTTSTDNQPGKMGAGGPAMSGNKPNGQPGQMPGTSGAKQPKQQAMKLQISAVTLLQLGAFGFTIIAFAVLLASMNVLRLEPRKILIG